MGIDRLEKRRERPRSRFDLTARGHAFDYSAAGVRRTGRVRPEKIAERQANLTSSEVRSGRLEAGEDPRAYGGEQEPREGDPEGCFRDRHDSRRTLAMARARSTTGGSILRDAARGEPRSIERPLSGAASAGAVLSVVYRSQAVRPLTGADLGELVAAARVRNRAESITGMVLYDDDRFYQWLEGPAESLGRVMRSINADGRHMDIRVLATRAAEHRLFRGRDLQLAALEPSSIPDRLGAIRPPDTTIARLRRDPDSAANLLAGFATHHRTALKPMVEADIVPLLIETVRRRLHAPRQTEGPPDAKTLGSLLLADRRPLARDLIAASAKQHFGVIPIFASLIEPAVRHVGDLWRDDLCSEVDLTLALCTLRAAVRELCRPPHHRTSSTFGSPRILVASYPGEPHSLASVLMGEALWHYGWEPRIDFPEEDADLRRQVALEHFDCLVLGLSAVTANAQSPAGVRTMIDGIRRSSGNPALCVVVSGRAAAEHQDFARVVGADTGCRTASRAAETVRAVLAAQHRAIMVDWPTAGTSREWRPSQLH